jgi:hypothetical protein
MYGGENEKGEAPIWQIAAAGCLAGFAQTPAVAAAEFCKTQMQMQFCRSKDAPQVRIIALLNCNRNRFSHLQIVSSMHA